MNTQLPRRQDIIIVGLGPSAVGLLYGLLSPYLLHDADATKQRKPNLSITVIERGHGHGHNNNYGHDHEQDHDHEHHEQQHAVNHQRINDPNQWFLASHSKNQNSAPLHSIPQRGLGGRIICLPTGKGFGGGTNINACLAVRPSCDDFECWPLQWREIIGGGNKSSSDDDSDDVVVSSLKKRARGRMRIMDSVLIIESVLRSNHALVEQPNLQIIQGVVQQKKNKINEDDDGKDEDEKERNDEGTTFHRVTVEQCFEHSDPIINQHLQPLPLRFVAKRNQNHSHNQDRYKPWKWKRRTDDEKQSQKKKDAGADDDANRNSNNDGDYSRVNYYEGILEPFLRRHPHLRDMITIYSDSQVERLITKKNAAMHDDDSHGNKNNKDTDDWIVEGVEILHKGQTRTTLMANNVVLCSGAFYSPALLMVSGIGDPVQLRQAGIAPLGSVSGDDGDDTDGGRNEWCGVGRNLRDHLVMTRLFFTWPLAKVFQGRSVNAVRGWIPLDVIIPSKRKGTDAGNEVIAIEKEVTTARVGFKIFDGNGFHQMIPYAGSCTFYRDVDLDRFGIPGLSTMMTMLVKCLSYVVYVILTVMMWIYPLAWMLNRCSAIVLFGLLDPQSRGRVWVERKRSCKEGWEASRMSEVDIRIDPAYLVDVRDLDQVEYGWRALDGIVPRLFPRSLEVLPGALFRDRKKYAADFSMPYFHWMGSCSMETTSIMGSPGQEEASRSEYVVDKDLKVRNVKGLYICDASILPANVSLFPALLLAAVGLTAAAFMKLDDSDTELITSKVEYGINSGTDEITTSTDIANDVQEGQKVKVQ